MILPSSYVERCREKSFNSVTVDEGRLMLRGNNNDFLDFFHVNNTKQSLLDYRLKMQKLDGVVDEVNFWRNLWTEMNEIKTKFQSYAIKYGSQTEGQVLDLNNFKSFLNESINDGFFDEIIRGKIESKPRCFKGINK